MTLTPERLLQLEGFASHAGETEIFRTADVLSLVAEVRDWRWRHPPDPVPRALMCNDENGGCYMFPPDSEERRLCETACRMNR